MRLDRFSAWDTATLPVRPVAAGSRAGAKGRAACHCGAAGHRPEGKGAGMGLAGRMGATSAQLPWLLQRRWVPVDFRWEAANWRDQGPGSLFLQSRLGASVPPFKVAGEMGTNFGNEREGALVLYVT